VFGCSRPRFGFGAHDREQPKCRRSKRPIRISRRASVARVDVDRGAFAVCEWCDRNSVSRTQLYKLWAANRGPRYFWLGKQKRISIEADIEWRAAMQAASDAALTENKG
jgi:hypothetical protein